MLRLEGYDILARNFCTLQGEIEVVAKHGRGLAFGEAKRRNSLDQVLNTLQARQGWRFGRAAEAFLAARPAVTDRDLRFDVMTDVMTVVPARWARHIRDAWRLP